MHSNYEDILNLTKKFPLWHDANGVPRFAKFSPLLCPNIYSNKVILQIISCAYCGKKFSVEMHSGILERGNALPPKKWHYGDPPIHDCVGDTMNCNDLEVLEVWVREDLEFKRYRHLEGKID